MINPTSLILGFITPGTVDSEIDFYKDIVLLSEIQTINGYHFFVKIRIRVKGEGMFFTIFERLMNVYEIVHRVLSNCLKISHVIKFISCHVSNGFCVF